jgi:hypothetical protein
MGTPAPQPAPAAQPAANPDNPAEVFNLRARSIIVQSLAKSVLSPDMPDSLIRERVQFLWKLTGEMRTWAAFND